MIGSWRDFQVFWQQPGKGFVKIIAVNAGIFVLLMLFRLISIFSGHSLIFESLLESLTLSSQVSHFVQAPWSLISYFFVHVEVFHLVFNMMFLYWFGMIIQEVVGNTKSLQIYFWGGISGAIAFFLAYHYIPYFANRGEAYLLGASAGVFAIVVAAATLRPNFEVMLFLIGSVRIKYIAGFYMLWSILETVGVNAGGNIAHLGGAMAGFCMAYLFEHPLKWPRSRKKQPVFIDSTLTRESPPRKAAENIEEDELNRILDKISKSGYDSLSKQEKRRLFTASQKNE